MQAPLTDEQLLAHVRSKLRTKGATGEAVASRLLPLSRISAYASLASMLKDPDGAWPRLAAHFRSPLAFQQHVGRQRRP